MWVQEAKDLICRPLSPPLPAGGMEGGKEERRGQLLYLLLPCPAGGGQSWFLLSLELGSAPSCLPSSPSRVRGGGCTCRELPGSTSALGGWASLSLTNSPGHSICGIAQNDFRLPLLSTSLSRDGRVTLCRGWEADPSPTFASHCLGSPPC